MVGMANICKFFFAHMHLHYVGLKNEIIYVIATFYNVSCGIYSFSTTENEHAVVNCRVQGTTQN